MKPEGRYKPSQYISCSREAVPPRILDPLLNRETRDKNYVIMPPDKSG